MSDIKIIALGGVRENAKNLYVVEVNDSIFILDAGLKYPENEQLGVDEVIPNIDYLVENKKRVQGIFLTHGHADAIGALPYILSEFKAPVFGSPLTIELAKLFVKKNNNVKKFNNFHVIDAETEIEFADATISFFKSTQFLKVWGLLSVQMREILFTQATSNLTKLPVNITVQTCLV